MKSLQLQGFRVRVCLVSLSRFHLIQFLQDSNDVQPTRALIIASFGRHVERLLTFLRSEADFLVLGWTESPEEAVAIAARNLPDVVLIDLDLPDHRAPDAFSTLATAVPSATLLGIERTRAVRKRKLALSAGAVGFVSAASPPDHTAEIIRQINLAVTIEPSTLRKTLPPAWRFRSTSSEDK